MQEKTYSVTQAGPLLPFLLEQIRGQSRNNVKSLLTRGQVQVDGVTVTRHDHPLEPGQVVVIRPQGSREAKAPFPVLYEDQRRLGIEKPAGLLSMASDREKVRTAYRMATDYVRRSQPKGRLFIVHRLDRDTSGVLLFAKDEGLKRQLQENWDRLVRRRAYVAVVEGAPPQEAGEIRSFLRETATHLVYSGAPGRDAREAVTRYRVLARSRGFSLVEVELDTGRKNQIRVHMKDLGCPVAGDRQYGAQSDPMGRLGLHAHALALTDPRSRRPLVLQAPWPEPFRRMFPGQG